MTAACHVHPTQFAEPPGPLATGPITPEGKIASSRNAVTHGLFARETVLPHLGEDPDAFQTLRNELAARFAPADALEQQCVETIAAAVWRLARFRQWLTALYQDLPDAATPEGEERLARLERTQRHERALQRQIDAALRTLGRTLPDLLAARSCPAPTQQPPPPDPFPLGKGGEPQRDGIGTFPAADTKSFQNELPRPATPTPDALPPPVRIAQTRCARRKQHRR